MNKRLHEIKQAQKEKHLFREIADLFRDASENDPLLRALDITRVELSQDKGVCYIYFYNQDGEAKVKDSLDRLILYRNSLRAALAKRINKRYTPEIVFKFDTLFNKRQSLEAALNALTPEERQ